MNTPRPTLGPRRGRHRLQLGRFRRSLNAVMVRRGIDTGLLIVADLLIVALGYWYLSADDYRMSARVPALTAATLWMGTECLLMFLRTEADDWDRFSWGLFVARLTTFLYIGSQAIEFSHYASFPDLYWDLMRTLFGLGAGLISVIVIGEIVRSFRQAPRWRKRRALIALTFLIGFVLTVSTIW